MIGYFDLRRGVRFIHESQPYEVLDFNHMKKAQREGIAQVKMKNLITGKVVEHRFDLSEEQIGLGAKFLKAGEIIDILLFEGKIISVALPIKVQLKVIEAPP